jgi:hypothetical protein
MNFGVPPSRVDASLRPYELEYGFKDFLFLRAFGNLPFPPDRLLEMNLCRVPLARHMVVKTRVFQEKSSFPDCKFSDCKMAECGLLLDNPHLQMLQSRIVRCCVVSNDATSIPLSGRKLTWKRLRTSGHFQP